MQKLILSLLLMSVFIFPKNAIQAQVVINEYSASNLTQYLDEFEKSEDWIELYNADIQPKDISGYYLSDNINNPTKWKIPENTTIGSNGYLIFWASGRDLVENGNYHTNFKITQTKSNPETLVLANSSGNVIDQIEIKKTALGHSRGRSTNGNSTWKIFTNPTFRSSNNSSNLKYDDYAKKPNFNLEPGFYNGSVSIIMSSIDPSLEIRYTTNGNAPSTTSTLYQNPVEINSTKIIKAICVSNDPNILPSFIEYNTYFINVSHTLPVISVGGSDLLNLANGDNMLRPIGSIEYFDKSGMRKGNSYGELNSHGQDSWVNDQRSLDWVSRDEMGYSGGIKEKLFSLSERDEFQKIILRAAGDDNYPGNFLPEHNGCAHVRDAYVQNLVKKGGLNLDVRISEKVIIYLNGQYWGVYDIREIPDDNDYTDFYYNQDKYDLQYILTWGNTWVQYGTNQALTDWDNLTNFILNNNMQDSSNYAYVNSQLDVTSLVDYVITNSMTVCSDWINYNTGWWRGFNPEGTHKKWGYILWDNDATFGYYNNYTGIPDTTSSASLCDVHSLVDPMVDVNSHIRVLNKLRTNSDFNKYYINRQIELVNTVFSCENMLSYLDSIVGIIDPEMTLHIQKWGGSYTGWRNNVSKLRNYISLRCESVKTSIASCYDLTGPYQVTFDLASIDSASMMINALNVPNLPYTGNYYGGIDLDLKIIDPNPNDNIQFVQWISNASQFSPSDTSKSVTLQITGNENIIAKFEEVVHNNDINTNDSKVNIYPTICKDNINIELTSKHENDVILELIDVNGRVIVRSNHRVNQGLQYFNVDLSKLEISNGNYFIRVIGNNLHEIKQIMILK
ncbi:MAG: CotH kinase family protein [Saprospiraceae bacterium]|nr:CotH kinase family protein [Saprospiraceae bacterium]